MKFLIFLVFSQVLTDQVVWDGKNNDFSTNYQAFLMYNQTSVTVVVGEGYINTNSQILSETINFNQNLKLRNIKILEIDISKYQPGEIGILMRVKMGLSGGVLYMYGEERSNGLLEVSNDTTCQLAECELGLYLFSKNNNKEIKDIDNTDVLGIFYMRLVTSDMNLRLGKFLVYRNQFPLIICPDENWLIKENGLVFVPFETNGISFNNFNKRYLMLPGYPRSDDTDVFVCGYIKYLDGSQLTISHEIEIRKNNEHVEDENQNTPNDEVETFKSIEDIRNCKESTDDVNYYHFIFSYNVKGYHKMKYIEKDLLEKNQIYYNDIIYLYDRNGEKIKYLESKSISNGDSLPFINPTCIREIPQLKFKVNLLSSNGSKIFESSQNIQTLNVYDGMLNRDNFYRCEIVIDEATTFPYLSKFYDREMEVLLISKDDLGNKIIHNKINFKNNLEGFKKYECEIRLKNSNFKYEYPIENLTFVTIPKDISIPQQDEVWQTRDDIVIQCSARISNMAKLENIKVLLSKNLIVEFSNGKNEKNFVEEDGFIKFKYEHLFEEDVDVTNITTECIYKTLNQETISIIKNGRVVEKIIAKKNNNINNSNNVNEDNKTKAIIGIVVGVFIIIVAIIVSIIILVRIKHTNKKKKRNHKKKNQKESY
uniref:Ig-like domain-containing protein n=1 Tax=Strongyloides papillosus TaxID=174720 RepID=A0A0N5BN51_STREA